jgi:hypothetical protein
MHAYYLLFCPIKCKCMKTFFAYLSKRTKKNLIQKEPGFVVMSGFEPPTHGFSVRCSTN